MVKLMAIKTKAIFLIHIVFPLLCSSHAWSQHPSKVDELIRAYGGSAFMGSVLIANGDDITFDKGYGFANVEWQQVNTSTTKFRIASITKQFTAAAVLLLAERKQLSLQDSITTHLPNAPATWHAVTIQHLLNHSSGIADDIFDREDKNPFEPFVSLQAIAKLDEPELRFKPGQQFSYSNAGYIILGALIEKISNKTYAQFLADNIFGPLAMHDSGFENSNDIISKRAAGYVEMVGGKSGLQHADYINMTYPHGAGSLYSTARDLLQWSRGLFGAKLLANSSITQLTTPIVENYGMGMMINTVFEQTKYWHNGGINGFSTHLAYYPKADITLVVLNNVETAPTARIVRGIERLLFDRHNTMILPSERTNITIAQNDLNRYAGEYQFVPNITMSIIRNNDHLLLQTPGQPPLALYPTSASVFYATTSDVEVTFMNDLDDKPNKIKLVQWGQVLRATRLR